MERSLEKLSFAINLIRLKKSMDKETLIRLAQPAATALLAVSICTLPITVKAYGELTKIEGEVKVKGDLSKRIYLNEGKDPYNPLHVVLCTNRGGKNTWPNHCGYGVNLIKY